MKSLDTLRCRKLYSRGMDVVDMKTIADEIQAEIDDSYVIAGTTTLSRLSDIPEIWPMYRWQCDECGGEVCDTERLGGYHYCPNCGRKILLPDSQDKLDADILLDEEEYCKKYNLIFQNPSSLDKSAKVVMRRHLIERQKKLDESGR